MARGKSTKLLATLPDDYRSDWVERLDRRTRFARAILQRIAALESDAGGANALGHAKASLIRRAAFLEAVVEGHELKLAAGQPLDIGGHTQSLNSLIGLYRLLGIERVARTVRTLREHMEAS